MTEKLLAGTLSLNINKQNLYKDESESDGSDAIFCCQEDKKTCYICIFAQRFLGKVYVALLKA